MTSLLDSSAARSKIRNLHLKWAVEGSVNSMTTPSLEVALVVDSEGYSEPILYLMMTTFFPQERGAVSYQTCVNHHRSVWT